MQQNNIMRINRGYSLVLFIRVKLLWDLVNQHGDVTLVDAVDGLPFLLLPFLMIAYCLTSAFCYRPTFTGVRVRVTLGMLAVLVAHCGGIQITSVEGSLLVFTFWLPFLQKKASCFPF